MRTSLALIAAALLGFWLGGQCGKPDLAAIARADRLQLVLQALDSAHLADSLVNVAREDSLSALRHQVQTLSTRRPVVISHTDSIVLRITDSALVAKLQGVLMHERAVGDSLVEAQTAIVGLWRDRWKSAVAERDSYRDVALALSAELQVAVRRPVRGRVRPCGFAGLGIRGATVGIGVCASL